MRPVASLVPYASNARTRTPAQIDLIARSISVFGFTNPILIDGEKADRPQPSPLETLRIPQALTRGGPHYPGNPARPELFYAIKKRCSVNLADKIVMRPVASLVPYASNARTHTPAQIDLIGFTNPILIDGEKGIIAGHARFLAAQKLRLAEVPTIELSWLTPAERQAYVIADNQTAIAGSGWDAEMLRLELGDLKELGFDLTLTGFDEIQLGTFLADKTEGRTDPDDVPEPPTHPVSEPGDLWLLGRHRLRRRGR